MPRSSPWGPVQGIGRVFAHGFGTVSTAGHGGIFVTEEFADAIKLSGPARARAIRQGGCYWYEEDCEWSVPVWEAGVTYWPLVFALNGYQDDYRGGTALLLHPGMGKPAERIAVRTYLLRTLSTWAADYLAAINQEPDPDGLAIWQQAREDERLRRERSPDLIVSAMGIGDGRVKVKTAAGTWHVVTQESYRACRTRSERNPHGLNLLSACELIEPVAAPGFY